MRYDIHDCIMYISIYTLSDLGVLSNLIGPLSLANKHCSLPTELIMRFANSRMLCTVCTFSRHELRGQLNRFLMVPSENVVEITSCVYTKTIILLNLDE